MTENPEILVSDLGLPGRVVIQSLDVNFQEPKSKESENSQESEVLRLNCPNQEAQYSLGATTSNKETPIKNLPVEGQFDLGDEFSNSQMGETIETRDGVDIDNGSLDVEEGKRISEPCFLKRVLREELGYYLSDNKLLFIAIHAVFLQSGFIGFDSVSKLQVDVFHFLEEQSSMSFTTSVSYTLPKLLLDDNITESVVLKFQTLGRFVNVYGSLANSQSWLQKLCLNKYKFVPAISFLWANCENSDSMNENDESLSMFYSENEIFDLWKVVKDELAYPLLIDLCEKTGLDLPPCLMQMPPELKLKILESFPGVDIARMACVCKEMRHLSSNNDLWKPKYAEEFGSMTEIQGTINWKGRFFRSRKHKKKIQNRLRFFHSSIWYYFTEDPSLNPFHVPGLDLLSTFALPDQTP